MQILLVNDNPSVSKLINLTAKKYGYSLDELADINELETKNKDIVFIDDALSSKIDLVELRNLTNCDEFVYIGKKNDIKPDEYKYMLTKPFLPSDFHDIVENISSLKNVAEEVFEDSDLLDSVEDEKLKKEEFKIDDIDLDNISNIEENLDEDINLDLDNESNEDEKTEEPENINNLHKEEAEVDIPAILDKEDIDEVKELLDEEESDRKEVDNMDEIIDTKDLEIEDFDITDLNIADENYTQTEKTNEDIPEQIKVEDNDKIAEKNEEEEPKDTVMEVDENISDYKTSTDKEENELDKIDEENLRELFGENSEIDNVNKEEDMYIETIKKVKKSKKSKKAKKDKKINNTEIKEEMVSQLLDIDTLREVLDGMEIRIKFYNKNKKK